DPERPVLEERRVVVVDDAPDLLASGHGSGEKVAPHGLIIRRTGGSRPQAAGEAAKPPLPGVSPPEARRTLVARATSSAASARESARPTPPSSPTAAGGSRR